MGWRRDWLHSRVFADYAKSWAEALKYARSMRVEPPGSIVIRQHPAVRLVEDHYVVSGDPIRQWVYRGTAFELLELAVSEDGRVRDGGKLFRQARGDFGFSEDRKTVVIETHFGSRYGCIRSFVVVGQGRSGRLKPHPTAAVVMF